MQFWSSDIPPLYKFGLFGGVARRQQPLLYKKNKVTWLCIVPSEQTRLLEQCPFGQTGREWRCLAIIHSASFTLGISNSLEMSLVYHSAICSSHSEWGSINVLISTHPHLSLSAFLQSLQTEQNAHFVKNRQQWNHYQGCQLSLT